MKEKTTKGKLKKIGFYGLCYTPWALAVGCLGLTIGGLVGYSVYGDKADKLYEEIHAEALLTDEFKEHYAIAKQNIDDAYNKGVLNDEEYIKKTKELKSSYYVCEYAKTLPEFSSKVELAQDYEKLGDNWFYGFWGIVGVAGFGIGGVFSHWYAEENAHRCFDSNKDLNKRKKKLEEKSKKLAEKAKGM